MEDKYKTLSATEIAGEDSFIRWVRNDENHTEWALWLQSNPDRELVLEEARYILKMMTDVSVPTIDVENKAALWGRIQKDIDSGKKKRNFQKQYRIMRWTMIAAAAIALMVWVKVSSGNQNIIVDPGVTADITLPESSSVTVNAGSTIKYNKKHFQEDREINLEGEAFFKVTHGSKFTVRTSQGSITVVGTSFNVIARSGQFEVSCYTGKVIVEQDQNDKMEITSGQRCFATEEKENLQLKTFDPSLSTPDWTRGKFTFENQPLSLVFNELERQYNVTVKLAPGISDLKYTGLFESGDLEEAVSLITWPRHLNAKISGKTVTISR